MSSEMPHVKWYARDWLGDPLLKLVGPAEKGLWIDLLCAMMMCEPYGHLTINGKAMSDEDGAKLTGIDIDTYKGILAHLEAVGIPSRTPEGILYSRRLVRDYERYRIASESGKRGGGNPALRKESRIQNTRSQKPEATLPLADRYKGGYKGTLKTLTETEKKRVKVKENTALMARIGKCFGRKGDTLWTLYEAEALTQLGEIPEPDLKIMEGYYNANLPMEQNYRRRDLATLLNNWNTELDRARQYKPPRRLAT